MVLLDEGKVGRAFNLGVLRLNHPAQVPSHLAAISALAKSTRSPIVGLHPLAPPTLSGPVPALAWGARAHNARASHVKQQNRELNVPLCCLLLVRTTLPPQKNGYIAAAAPPACSTREGDEPLDTLAKQPRCHGKYFIRPCYACTRPMLRCTVHASPLRCACLPCLTVRRQNSRRSEHTAGSLLVLVGQQEHTLFDLWCIHLYPPSVPASLRRA